jgi:hypothetical protein
MANTIRHAELVSASTAQHDLTSPNMTLRWTLKQVQGDGGEVTDVCA